MMTRMYTLIAAAPLALMALFGCAGEESAHKWQATIYATGGDEGQMLGPFASREECTEASMQHLGAGDGHDQPMAFGCAMMK